MDLISHHQPGLSNLLINLYAEQTGDYSGLTLLKFYQCYRAMVRAKISALQNQSGELKKYLDLAEQYTQSTPTKLNITFGLSGSGKSIYTENRLLKEPVIRLRSDVIRKQLKALLPFEPAPEKIKSQLYANKHSKAVYQHLQFLARILLQAQWSVIIDAACLKFWQRHLFFELSAELKIPINIYAFHAPLEQLKKRIRDRQSRHDASDADIHIVEMQLAHLEPLNEQELAYTIPVMEQTIESLILNRC
jgi:predicted kinase